MNERFVSAWVNKTPATKFPDGLYKLLRDEDYKNFPLGAGVTNVTAIFATSDGTVLNAVPGYLNLDAFRAEMQLAVDLYAKITDEKKQLKPDAADLYKKTHTEYGKEIKAHGGYRTQAHGRLAEAGLLTLDKLTFTYFNDWGRGG